MRRLRLRRPQSWIPYGFVGFFFVVIAANATMVGVALDSWTGLRTEDAYQKGLEYDEVLAARKAQEALGWDVRADVETPGDLWARVEVALDDAEGRPLDADRVRIGFFRPTHDGYDRTATLERVGYGRFAGELKLPLAGQWELRVAAERGEDAYRLSRRVMMPAE